jgi:gamma-glutamyltranspeptidase/glutathione hydrolase
LSFSTRPELQGTFGMVASTHWLASAAGMAVMEKGGNAFDAAVAAGFVLQVVEPHLNGPGGDLPILLHSAGEGCVRAVCGQGCAPAGATIEHFQSLDLTMVPGTGLLAACVPGAFGAWLLLLRDYGTVGLREVLEPAIGYAQHGYPVLPRISSIIATVEDYFRQHWPTSAAVYLADGVPQPGTLHRNPDLAATYARLLQEAEAASGDRDGQIEHARQAWYEGWVAEAMERYVTRTEVLDVSGSPHAGLLTGQDMASWRASVDQPVHIDYGDYRVFKCGPWSQGPVFLQQLSLLAGFDLRAMGLLSADYLHTVLECAKLAFADREAWYGDPDFVEVPLQALLDPAYAAGRRRLIEPMASLELRPGRPDGLAPRIPDFGPPLVRVGQAGLGEAALGDPTVTLEGETRGDTCHVDAADRFGNLVSATPSGGWLQSSPVIPGLGFCLGNRAQVFNLEPGHPNALAPRKRPRTTLSPSLAYRDGEPYLAFGTPGADQQDQWSLNFFVAYANSGLNLQQAIEMPMFHTDHFPRSFYAHESYPGRVHVEERLDSDAIAGLRSRGHEVVIQDAWSLGRISAVARHPKRGLLAAANPRGVQGYAVGR